MSGPWVVRVSQIPLDGFHCLGSWRINLAVVPAPLEVGRECEGVFPMFCREPESFLLQNRYSKTSPAGTPCTPGRM